MRGSKSSAVWFHNQAVTAHHRLGEQLLLAGNYEAGISAGRKLLTLEPSREGSYRLLMQLLGKLWTANGRFEAV